MAFELGLALYNSCPSLYITDLFQVRHSQEFKNSVLPQLLVRELDIQFGVGRWLVNLIPPFHSLFWKIYSRWAWPIYELNEVPYPPSPIHLPFLRWSLSSRLVKTVSGSWRILGTLSGPQYILCTCQTRSSRGGCECGGRCISVVSLQFVFKSRAIINVYLKSIVLTLYLMQRLNNL